MTTDSKLEGQCLCGTVTVRIVPPDPHVDACHCRMCQRWGGSALLSLRMVTDPDITGTEHIGRYASSDWAERGFCRQCGTHLFFFYKPKASYSFTAGLFGGAADFTMTEEIFIDEKPGYYDFAGERERLTGPEVMAKFGVGNS
ncbi:GFA family protein [Sphingopyxis sp. KK2]|uniref:GFA family protein n=1 Tax=Sphingopyxis sp. KK2 TaxID=1855727 RepID=UPI00097E57B9|nr:GFA family protein [Sphingopyxis sp. KK2]